MTLPSLYQLSQEYRAEADKLADLDLPPEVIEDTLESLSGDLEVKATNTIMVVRNLEAMAGAIKAAEAQMAERRKSIESRAASIRDHVLANMLIAGIEKIECPYFKLSVRENPPAVDVFQPELVPTEYMRQPEPPPPAIDKKAILAAIKEGVDVPGCTVTRGKRLDVK